MTIPDPKAVRAFLEERHVGRAAEAAAFSARELRPRPEPRDDAAARDEARTLLSLIGGAGWLDAIRDQDWRGCCLAREALAARVGDITVDDVMGVMLDDFETPWSICYPPRPSSPSHPDSIYVTVATLIMRPILGEMRVAMLPALDKRFTLYTLGMEGATFPTTEAMRAPTS